MIMYRWVKSLPVLLLEKIDPLFFLPFLDGNFLPFSRPILPSLFPQLSSLFLVCF
jgi:hypothetical protein